MAMETVTNYKCDRCGRSEIRDNVTVLTLTVRERNNDAPGQGKSKFSQHVCAENCLKMIIAAMKPVGRAGHYDRKRGQKPATTAVRGPLPRPGTATAPDPAKELEARTRAIKMITRKPGGGWAKGHNYRTEVRMIEEAKTELKIK